MSAVTATTYVWAKGPSSDMHHLYRQGAGVWESLCLLGLNVGLHDLRMSAHLRRSDLCPTCRSEAGVP